MCVCLNSGQPLTESQHSSEHLSLMLRKKNKKKSAFLLLHQSTDNITEQKKNTQIHFSAQKLESYLRQNIVNSMLPLPRMYCSDNCTH